MSFSVQQLCHTTFDARMSSGARQFNSFAVRCQVDDKTRTF